MPRVAPITGKSDVPAQHQAVVDGVIATFGQIRGPFSMLLHSPGLAQHVLGIVNFFRSDSVVDQKLRSLAILVAAREREGAYVWAAQAAAARRAGVREEAIDLIRAKGDPVTLPPEERDQTSLIAAEIEDPKQGARLAKDIDIRFDGEEPQTFSQEDKALNTAIVGRFGAMLSAMNVVSLLVLGVVVLILGNTIALSTRERIREFGTLRAIGFLPQHLVAFVLGEAAVLGLAGGGLGVALAYPLVQGPLSKYLEQEMQVAPLRVATADAVGSLLLGVMLGLLAAGLPALRAGRLPVTQSLSHVN